MSSLPNITPIRSNSGLRVICHLVLLLILSYVAFNHNPGALLIGNDGATGYSLAEEQLTFYGITPHLHSNLLEGLGNISLPYNFSLQPGYWYGAFVQGGPLANTLLYSSFALQLFLSVLIIGWNYRFLSRVIYAAAWLLTLLAFPYFNSFRIYAITSSMPNFVSIILVFALMDLGIQRMGRAGWLKTFCYGGVTLAGFAMGLMTCPVLISLLAPMLILSSILAFATTRDRNELIRKLVMSGVLLIVVSAFGWIEFVAGMMLNASGIFFKSEMDASSTGTASLIYTSILFHGKLAGMAVGPWLFCGGALGSILAIRKERMQRSLAIAILIAQVTIVVGGMLAVTLLASLLSTISTIYFEIILLPFYALFTTYLLGQILTALLSGRRFNNRFDYIWPVVMVMMVAFLVLKKDPILQNKGNFSTIPASTALTEILSNKIALAPKKLFAGRVMTMMPGKGWLHQMQYSSGMNFALGNDHQSTGLWLKHIPTLHEYSQTITPGFYRLYRRFLSDGTDAPYRSWSNFNKVDLKMFQLLGVQYVLSTLPNIDGAVKLTTLDPHNSNLPLSLFELKQANTAGISAAQYVNVNSFRSGEAFMISKQYQINDAVVIRNTKDVQNRLVAVLKSKLSVESGGMRLQATSKGKSLLILPIEFSHCMVVTPHAGDAPKVIRVDLALTGIEFDKFVDVKIDSRTGPFANPRCRLKDYREFSHLWKM